MRLNEKLIAHFNTLFSKFFHGTERIIQRFETIPMKVPKKKHNQTYPYTDSVLPNQFSLKLQGRINFCLVFDGEFLTPF